MKNYFFIKLLLALLISLLFTEILLAQKDLDWRFSGLSYFHYYYDFSKNSQDKNGFDLSRLYLTVRKDFSDNIGVRVTSDLGRVSNDQEKGFYWFYLKYGYIEFRKPSWKMKLLVGLHYVPLLAFQENIWGYRSISKMLTDLEHKQTSSDLGVKLLGQFPKEYGDYAFSFVNGEGYNNPELGKYKGVYGRITVRPLPSIIDGFRLTGFASNIQHNQESSTILTTFFATFESEKLTLGAEHSSGYEKTVSGRTNYLGYSFFGVYKISDCFTLIGRIDKFDPKVNMGNNTHLRKIIGIGYKIDKDIELIFDIQTVQYDDNTLNENSNIIYLHLSSAF